MINTAKALYGFYSGFGLPAYTTMNVPDEAELPYITYSLPETEPLRSSTHYCQVWGRTREHSALLAKADEILQAIGEGVRLECGGGYVVIRPNSPRAQVLRDEDPDYQYVYISLQINCYHK